ncbi:MAG: hypothetical protein ACPG61_07250 [Paracoccaceae bacterium]
MTTIRTRVTAAFDKIAAKQPDAIQTGSVQQPTPAGTGGGPSDPTGGTPGVTPDPVAARMAVFEIDEKRVDGTNIQAGDFQVIVEPIGIEVTLADKIICDRGTLTIAKLGRVASGGQTALYDMVCRG